jgi:hypothetical protein
VTLPKPDADWVAWWKIPTPDQAYDEKTHTIKPKTNAGRHWKKSIERFALMYELARRYRRNDGFPPYTTDVGNDHVETLRFHLGYDDLSEAARPLSSAIPGLDMADGPWGPLNVLWHFAASVDRAVKEFRKQFKKEQERRGIRRKTRGPCGHKNRNASWRGVELLDDVYLSNDKPRHNANDRSKLARARANAKIYHKMLVSIISDT